MRLSLPIALMALSGGIVLLLVTLIPTFTASERGGTRTKQAIPPSQTVAQQELVRFVQDQRLLPLTPEAARTFNMNQPIAPGPLVAAKPFISAATGEAMARATDCLAAAGWYEIGDDRSGQRAVMQVVLNRVHHPAFPASVCGVVFQGAERATGCQFTFTCDGSMLRRSPSPAAWTRARSVAAAALAGAVDRDVGLSTHYHAGYVVPYWASSLVKSAQIGPHLFYRWAGSWGTPANFVRHIDGAEPVVSAMAGLSPPPQIVDAQTPATVAPASAVKSPPPAILVAGVREKSLRGAVVRGGGDNSGQYFVQLDPGTFPGNYATAALALCKNNTECTVFGWSDVSQVAQSLPLNPAQRAELSFYYTQASDGRSKALWNCRQVPRSNKAQCLGSADAI
ncbi:cell wall hydrolase [Sphingomonas bacterium]|uniref:cell wall hydrolase n=1 Tax=Sphingomonas bacterium TaxID=1895847 RepID=UPI0015772977|nr:cell wall hydrolase [Sphingomonas bacterium]